MPGIPKWARDYRKERQEFAVVFARGRWRPATYLGKAWFNPKTEMRYRLGGDFEMAVRWCQGANEARLRFTFRMERNRGKLARGG